MLLFHVKSTNTDHSVCLGYKFMNENSPSCRQFKIITWRTAHTYKTQTGGRTAQYIGQMHCKFMRDRTHDIDELESENRLIQRVSGLTRVLLFFVFFSILNTVRIQKGYKVSGLPSEYWTYDLGNYRRNIRSFSCSVRSVGEARVVPVYSPQSFPTRLNFAPPVLTLSNYHILIFLLCCLIVGVHFFLFFSQYKSNC